MENWIIHFHVLEICWQVGRCVQPNGNVIWCGKCSFCILMIDQSCEKFQQVFGRINRIRKKTFYLSVAPFLKTEIPFMKAPVKETFLLFSSTFRSNELLKTFWFWGENCVQKYFPQFFFGKSVVKVTKPHNFIKLYLQKFIS